MTTPIAAPTTILGSIGTTVKITANGTTEVINASVTTITTTVGIAEDLALTGRIHSKALLRQTAKQALADADDDPRSTEEMLALLGL